MANFEKSGNIYENQEAIDGESERLKKSDFPAWVTREILSEEINVGDKIIDIGSGENPELMKLAHEKGANYIAYDVRLQALQKLMSDNPEYALFLPDGSVREGGALDIDGNAEELPVRDNSMDFTHSRLVEAWLGETGREKSLKEEYRVLKPGGMLVTMDFDWNTSTGGELITRFVELAKEILPKVGFDPTYGGRSFETVKEILPDLKNVEVQSYKRAGEYSEIFDKERPLIAMAKSSGDEELAARVEKLFFDLKEARDAGRLEPFTQPDLVVVTGIK